jgi:predicted nucleic acid-binding protein
MRLFLDSSVIIDFMGGDSKAIEKIGAAEEIYTSIVCGYEVLVGERFLLLKGRESKYDRVLDFFKTTATLPPSLDDAKTASDIMVGLMLAGKVVDPLDTIIAAQAISVDASLVTKNRKHFDAIREQDGRLKTEYI